MPVVNLTLPKSMPVERRNAVSDAVHQALVSEFDAPPDGKFHIVATYDSENLLRSDKFLGVNRGDDFMFVQITAMNARSDDQKRSFLRGLRSNLLASAGVKPQDLFVHILDTSSSNWFCLNQACN
ncbi:tautomerase family protein [Rhodoblastus sp.]|jgi:phenylpyruvate tautomerase PptA (4-oxalocrotonate tautomerase family)|uniref:tautomerase family protein n=1 Tax=Rhodoblastus sp. TaxID=1962975 RepID=UPI0025DAA491|nr:tautomerase family protein [Rhodoblastus sp.]